MNPKYLLFRALLVTITILLIVFTALARFMTRFQDQAATIVVMLPFAVYAMLRGISGRDRREAMLVYERSAGTPMAWTMYTIPYMRAATAWAVLDAAWIVLDGMTCLTWGIPGAMGLLFQALFFLGCRILPDYSPELYSSDEQARAVDMLEASMYIFASAYIQILAWFLNRA